MAWIYKPKKDRRNELNRKERIKIYNTQRWRDLRAWKMTNYPLCEECLKNDKNTAVEDVHHIISFMSTNDPIERSRLAFDYNNLMSICKECHAKKHA